MTDPTPPSGYYILSDIPSSFTSKTIYDPCLQLAVSCTSHRYCRYSCICWHCDWMSIGSETVNTFYAVFIHVSLRTLCHACQVSNKVTDQNVSCWLGSQLASCFLHVIGPEWMEAVIKAVEMAVNPTHGWETLKSVPHDTVFLSCD